MRFFVFNKILFGERKWWYHFRNTLKCCMIAIHGFVFPHTVDEISIIWAGMYLDRKIVTKLFKLNITFTNFEGNMNNVEKLWQTWNTKSSQKKITSLKFSFIVTISRAENLVLLTGPWDKFAGTGLRVCT